MKNCKVSIIIPSLNRPKNLINTLKCVLRQNYKNYETIVIDQSDKIESELRKFIKKNNIRFFHILEKNVANARNEGLKRAKGEIVLFLDDDVIFGPDLIVKHLQNYNDPKIGGIMGNLTNLQRGRFQIRKEPSQHVIRRIGYIRWFDSRPIGNWSGGFKTEIQYMAGSNVSYRKKALEEVNGFDASFGKGFAFMEDCELAIRIRKIGYKLIFEPKAKMEHLQVNSGGTRQKNLLDFRYWYCYNYSKFIYRHYNFIRASFYFLQQIFQEFIRAIYYHRIKIFNSGVRGLINGFSARKEFKGMQN